MYCLIGTVGTIHMAQHENSMFILLDIDCKKVFFFQLAQKLSMEHTSIFIYHDSTVY